MIRFGKNPISLKQPLSFVAKVYARPKNSKPPAISGSGTVGAAQSRVAGSWTGSSSITWAWFLDGQEVAQGGTYTPVAQDSGKLLTVLERAVSATGLGASSRSVGVLIP